MNKSILLILSIVIGYASCKPQAESIPADTSPKKPISKAEQLIDKSIEAHGGWDQWQDLQELKYKKHSVLLQKGKIVENEVYQNHHYTYAPKFIGTYTYEDTIKHKVVYQDDKAYRIDGDVKNGFDDKSRNSFRSAYYVLNMPWKLKDSGAVTSYEGRDTLFNGKAVESVKVAYPKGERDDIWWYYFHPKTSVLMACKVYHAPTYALIVNDEQAVHQGLLWNTKRTTYRVDTEGQPEFVRGRYGYEYGE